MDDLQLNPYYRIIEWDGDFIVPEGLDAILTCLTLVDSDGILSVESDGVAVFI